MNAVEMRTLCRIRGVSLADQINNEKIQRMAGKKMFTKKDLRSSGKRGRPRLTLENTIKDTGGGSCKKHEDPRRSCMKGLMTVDEAKEVCRDRIIRLRRKVGNGGFNTRFRIWIVCGIQREADLIYLILLIRISNSRSIDIWQITLTLTKIVTTPIATIKQYLNNQPTNSLHFPCNPGHMQNPSWILGNIRECVWQMYGPGREAFIRPFSTCPTWRAPIWG